MLYRIISLLIIVTLAGCGGAINQRVDSIPSWTVTSGGVRIKQEPGITISVATQNLIELGLQNTFAKARCKGYTKSLNLNDYTVAIIKGEMRNGIPVYRIPCGQYCGGEYDQGGFIYAAGAFLEPDTIVIPDQADPSQIVGYEAEHRILKDNDIAEFKRTEFHGTGTGHPIIAPCG